MVPSTALAYRTLDSVRSFPGSGRLQLWPSAGAGRSTVGVYVRPQRWGHLRLVASRPHVSGNLLYSTLVISSSKFSVLHPLVYTATCSSFNRFEFRQYDGLKIGFRCIHRSGPHTQLHLDCAHALSEGAAPTPGAPIALPSINVPTASAISLHHHLGPVHSALRFDADVRTRSIDLHRHTHRYRSCFTVPHHQFVLHTVCMASVGWLSNSCFPS